MELKFTKRQRFWLIISMIMAATSAVMLICEMLRPLPENYQEPPAAAKEVRIKLVAVGDNLMHMPLIKSGKTADGYNFDGFYANIVPYLADADMKIINQETVFVNDPSRYSGYPSFGGPIEVGDAVINAGFNIVQQASNHSYDKGEQGLKDTYEYWKSKGVTLLGINQSPDDKLRVDKFEKDGFTVAMINYTYGLNGYVLPAGKEYLVDVMSEEEKDAIRARMAKAKEQSDLLVVMLHWGTEYSTRPGDEQKNWLEFFNENGADVIIGSHPHVLQPYEMYTGESGNQTLVFYSLGNFISNQSGIEKELGGMARVTLVKDENGARVEEYSLLPCFTHIENGKYSVYMLNDYSDDMAKKHSKYGGGLTTEKIMQKFEEITGAE